VSAGLRRALALLSLLGLLCTLPPLAARVAAEAASYRDVELAPAAAEFCNAGVGLAALKRAGATAVFLSEQSVGDMEAEGLVTLAAVPGGTRLLAPPDVAAWLRTRLPSWPVVSERRVELRQRLVGFWRGDLEAVERAGLRIDARAYDAKALRDLRGFPVDAAWFAAQLREVPAGAAAALRVPLGVAEGPQQLGNVPPKGLRRLFAAAGGRAVRVFDPQPVLYARNTPRDTELETLRAAAGRNVRVLVVHPVPGVSPRENAAMVAATAGLLRRHGFRLAPPRPLPPLRVPLWARAGMALGAAAAVALLAGLLGAGAWAWALAAASFADPSVAASLAFPGLALWLLARRPLAGPAGAWRNVWLGAGLALAGGLYVGGYLADQAHMMEWSLFHGVKLLLVVPPLLAVLALFRAGVWPPAERLLEVRVRAWHVLLLLALLLAAYVYLMRSGNAGAALAPGLEVRMRDWFDVHLAARPREKEFLIGWPALVLAGFAAGRSRALYGALLVAGSTALASVVDTFAHTRTALVTSLERTGYGLALGLALGALAYVLAWAIDRYSAWYRSPMRSRAKR
jgi:hypothetical protein